MHEGAKIFDVLRVRSDHQIADPRAYYLIRGFVTIHPRHGVVAFGEVAVFQGHLDLLVFGQVNRDRPFHFAAPDRFRTIRDEGAVAFITLPQTPQRPRPLNRLPASVGYLRYKLDLPGFPVSRRLLADNNPRHVMSAFDQWRANHGPNSRPPVRRDVSSGHVSGFDVMGHKGA